MMRGRYRKNSSNLDIKMYKKSFKKIDDDWKYFNEKIRKIHTKNNDV